MDNPNKPRLRLIKGDLAEEKNIGRNQEGQNITKRQERRHMIGGKRNRMEALFSYTPEAAKAHAEYILYHVNKYLKLHLTYDELSIKRIIRVMNQCRASILEQVGKQNEELDNELSRLPNSNLSLSFSEERGIMIQFTFIDRRARRYTSPPMSLDPFQNKPKN